MPRRAEQRLGSEPVVALGVVGRHAALVGEPHLDAAPGASRLACQQLVGAPGGGAAAERQVRHAALLAGALELARDLRGGALGHRLGVGQVVSRVTRPSPALPSGPARRWGRAAAPGGCPRRARPVSPREAPGIVHCMLLPARARGCAHAGRPGRGPGAGCAPTAVSTVRPSRPGTSSSGAASRRRLTSWRLPWALPASASPWATSGAARPLQPRGQPAGRAASRRRSRRDGGARSRS